MQHIVQQISVLSASKNEHHYSHVNWEAATQEGKTIQQKQSTKHPQVPVSSTGHPAGGDPSGSQTSLFQKILTFHLRLD